MKVTMNDPNLGHQVVIDKHVFQQLPDALKETGCRLIRPTVRDQTIVYSMTAFRHDDGVRLAFLLFLPSGP